MDPLTLEQFAIKAVAQSSGVANPEQWLVDYFNSGQTSSSGVRVTANKALGLPAVWASVQLIAGYLASMPIRVKRENGDRWEELPNHPASKLLNREPNELQSDHTFKETLMIHALLEGNGRAVIFRNQLGQPIELLIAFPESVHTQMWQGEKYHLISIDPNYYVQALPGTGGPPPGGLYRVHDRDVFHIPGLSYNGLWGNSVISQCKDTFGIDSAGQDSAGYSFRNNGRPGLLLESPRGAFRTEKESKEFMAAFNAAHEGPTQAMKTGMIREGMKAHVLPMSAQDSQFIESRNFSREDIAMIFGTQNMLGEGKAVYKDLAERVSAFITNTLSRWFHRWTTESERKLLSAREQAAGNITFEFDTSQFVKGDPNTLADFTGKLRQQEVISGNEARRMLGFNPVEGLDEYNNPNTSSGAEPEPEEEPAEETEPPANKAARFFIANLIESETRQLVAATRRKDFLGSVKRIYDKLRPKICELLDAIDLDQSLADEYCQRSIDQVMEAAAVSTPETLKASIETTTATWPERVNEFHV